MFRSFIAITLATLFVVQSFTRTFIVVNYQLNKGYISANLCENKENKEMKCEGKCYMKKELQKDDKKENTPVGSSKVKFETNLFNNNSGSLLLLFPEIHSHIFFYPEENTNTISFPVFHPPALTA